jgi:hypothetical protein
MTQVIPSAEPPETPPPLPVRSRLRNDAAHRLKLYTMNSSIINMIDTSASAVSQTFPRETDCELTGTRQRSRSAICERRKMQNHDDPKPRESSEIINARSQNRGSDSSKEEDTLSGPHTSKAGSKVSMLGDLLEPLHVALLASQLTTPGGDSQRGSEERMRVTNEGINSLRRNAAESASCHGATSAVKTIGSNLNNSSSLPQPNVEAMVTKVSDWLAYGLLNPSLPETDCPRLDSRGTDRSFPSKPVVLSLFPPTSPSTGNREYIPPNSLFKQPVCPASPLNNGRDVYGNYIPSNTRDYLTAQSQTFSPTPQPIMGYTAPFVSERSSSMGRFHGDGWSKFKALWKAADAQVSDSGANPHSLRVIPEQDVISRDVPVVTYRGRSDNRAPSSIRSQLSTGRSRADLQAIDSVKSGPSTIYTTRNEVQETKVHPKAPVSGTASVSNHRLHAVTNNYKTTPRDEKRWHRDNILPPPRRPPPPPQRSVRHNKYIDRLTDEVHKDNCGEGSLACTKSRGDRPSKSPRDQSLVFLLEVERDSKERHIKKQQSHQETNHEREEDLMNQQVHKQEQDLVTGVPENGITEAMLAQKVDSRFGLERVVDSSLRALKNPATSSTYLPRHGPIPVSSRYPKKLKHRSRTTSHPSTVPAPASIAPATVVKSKISFQAVLLRAGKLSRSTLASHFKPEVKTGSERLPSAGLNKNEPTKLGMSADCNGWPRHYPLNLGIRISNGEREIRNRSKNIEDLVPEKDSGEQGRLGAALVNTKLGGSHSSILTDPQGISAPSIKLASTSNLTAMQNQLQLGNATQSKADDILYSDQTTQKWIASVVFNNSTTMQPVFGRSSDIDENSRPLNTEANSLVAHYQVLTTGAFDPPSSPTLSTRNPHESLDSATQEALLIAQQTQHYDARHSAEGHGDIVRSSFSSDSTEDMTQQEEEKEKKRRKRKKKVESLLRKEDCVRGMALMHSYE